MAKAGRFRRAIHRLTSSTADLESADRQRTVAQEEGAVAIRTCEDRQAVRLTGTVATVGLAPRAGHPALEVELDDGSGSVTLVWLGRRHIRGIEAGRALRVEGRISCQAGRRVIYNPHYELLTSTSTKVARG